jgi:nickel-dependent lactate racemase
MNKIVFTNKYFGELSISSSYEVTEYYPRTYTDESGRSSAEIIRQAVDRPIGCSPLTEVKPADKVLVIVDDKSRTTPVSEILPFVLERLRQAGVQDGSVTILIALGTHRPMTNEELQEKVGPEVFARYRVVNHSWDDSAALRHLGATAAGTDIWVNRLAVEADYIIGIGHIVPHRVAGFSGGGKIVQPGISGPVTTGQTHWLSAYYSAEEMLGNPDNPVRREIEEVAARVGLKFIVNVVQDSAGKVAGVFAGDPVQAHRAGCEFARGIYGVAVGGKADIVIAEAYPAELELWQATKALQAADVVVKSGGQIILLAQCPEGISRSHGRLIERFGFKPLPKVERLVAEGAVADPNVASYLARVGNVLEKNRTILVSQGISAQQSSKIGFESCSNVKEAFLQAVSREGGRPKIAVLHQGSELLPIL